MKPLCLKSVRTSPSTLLRIIQCNMKQSFVNLFPIIGFLLRSQQQLLDSTMTSTTSKSSITAVKTTPTTIEEEPEQAPEAAEAKTNGESEGILLISRISR